MIKYNPALQGSAGTNDGIYIDNINTIKYYSVFMALMPVISTYYSGVPGLNVGDLILLFFLGLSFINKLRGYSHLNVKTTSMFSVLIGYIMLSSCISIILQDNSSQEIDIFIRTFRFSFYMLCIIVTSRRYFNINIALKWVIRISLLGTLYIIVQYISYINFKIVLKGFLPFIPIYTKNYAEKDYSKIFDMMFFRPTSFFLEPAHFTQYVLVGLITVLFKDEKVKNKNMCIALILTAGVILSTSSQGLLFVMVIWVIWCVKFLVGRFSKNSFLIFLILLLIIPSALINIHNTNVVQNTLSRVMTDDVTNSTAFKARFGGFDKLSEVQSYYKYIGMGYGSVPKDTWMSSAAYMLYGGGIIGFIITVLLFLLNFSKNKNAVSRLMCLIFFLMFFGTSIFNSYMLAFYFSFICYPASNESSIKNTSVFTNNGLFIEENILK